MEEASVQAGQEGQPGQSGGQPERRPRRRQVGVVTSDVRDKTITVMVDFQVRHSRYGKQMRRRIKLQAHDEKNQARVGDRVQLMECRPISKTKSWRLEKIVEAAARPATA